MASRRQDDEVFNDDEANSHKLLERSNFVFKINDLRRNYKISS